MLQIIPFEPKNQAVIKNLILAGLVEHWRFLDEGKNPDLENIAHSYADGIFLVGWLNGQIVGCGAISPHSNQTAQIVRMSVVKDFRRHGIGQQILQALIGAARQHGYQRIVLETTSSWTEVVAFYLNNGFRITHQQDGDTHFVLDLSDIL